MVSLCHCYTLFENENHAHTHIDTIRMIEQSGSEREERERDTIKDQNYEYTLEYEDG